MRLYRTAAGRWAGTQAEAGKGFTQVEIPTDKPGLLDWLNGRGEEGPVELDAPERAPPAKATNLCPACHRSPSAGAAIAESNDLEAIQVFILDRATQTQIEQIFSSLGARFHELGRAIGSAR